MMPSRWDLLTEPFVGKLIKSTMMFRPAYDSWLGHHRKHAGGAPGLIFIVKDYVPKSEPNLRGMGTVVLSNGTNVLFFDVQGRWNPARRFVELC